MAHLFMARLSLLFMILAASPSDTRCSITAQLSVFEAVFFSNLGDGQGKHYEIKSYSLSLQRSPSYLFSYFQITYQAEGFMRARQNKKSKKCRIKPRPHFQIKASCCA